MNLAIVIPVFNDQESLLKLLKELQPVLKAERHIHEGAIVIVDDGSTTPVKDAGLHVPGDWRIEVLRTEDNQGHQKAIVGGLRRAKDSFPEVTHFMVMDSDGEDTPEGAALLVEQAIQTPDAAVVAQRGSRSESRSFRFWYRAHRMLFWALTGNSLNFGNFVLLPRRIVDLLLLRPATEVHFPSALLLHGTPLVRVTVDRGRRHFGKSTMRFENLVAHSLSGLSLFLDRILVRILFASTVITALILTALLGVVALRLFHPGVEPGWASTVAGLLIILLAQNFGFLGVSTIISLANRKTALTGR